MVELRGFDWRNWRDNMDHKEWNRNIEVLIREVCVAWRLLLPTARSAHELHESRLPKEAQSRLPEEEVVHENDGQ